MACWKGMYKVRHNLSFNQLVKLVLVLHSITKTS
jgi:hypothetical protein